MKQPRKRTPPRAQLAAERVAHEETRRERDAYKKAKAENDERFMTERDEARALADAERQARERAEAALSRARELLRENRAAFAICQIPAATMEVDGFDGGPWDMCPHCGAVAEECDKLADCWGAKTRAYLAAPAASRSPDGEPCRACGWSFHPMCCNASEHPDANPTTSKE